MGKNNFLERVQISKPTHSFHDLSHTHTTTLNMGYLVPTMYREVLPTDRIKLGCESITKFMPLVAPPMWRMDVRHEYFFVPYRILWKNFETFITGQNLQSTGLPPAFPTVSALTSWSVSPKLCDYLRVPDPTLNPGALNDRQISAFPFAAYQKVRNDYYRNQVVSPDLTDQLTLVDGNNDANTNLFTFHKRAWNADIFTKSAPDTQKGDPVTLTSGEVILDPNRTPGVPVTILDATTNAPQSGGLAAQPGTGILLDGAGAGGSSVLDPNGTLVTQQLTVNELRFGESLQRLKEKMMRAGSRYFEFLRSFFGQISPDARLQRPEYIYGTKSAVVISEVLNTTGTPDAPQGTMAGHANAINAGADGYYTAQEHGCIICMTSVMPRTGYFQGFEKHWLKINSYLDYSIPEMSQIGEQPVTIDEVFAYQLEGEQPFGYMPKDYDYRNVNNIISGDMKNNLLFWNLARKFDTTPTLSEEFVYCDPSQQLRIFADTDPDVDHITMNVMHDLKMFRPITKFGTPSRF